MFAFTRDFNQPLITWDVSRVPNAAYMFFCSKAFNQPAFVY
jgi:hypothetical protein